MRVLPSSRRSAAWMVAAVLLLTAVGSFVWNYEITGAPPADSAQGVDEATAARALGQNLPHPVAQVSGWHRTELTLAPADPATPLVPAMVYQAFALGGPNVAVLTVFHGKLAFDIPSAYDSTVVINGAVVAVKTHQIFNGSTAVNYKWERHGLVYNFEIALGGPIDRVIADRIVAETP